MTYRFPVKDATQLDSRIFIWELVHHRSNRYSLIINVNFCDLIFNYNQILS